MGRKVILVSVAVLVFTLVLVAFAGTALASYNFTTHTADHSAVASSPHNVAAPTGNPCAACHIPHGAQGAYLWAQAPNPIVINEDAATTGYVGTSLGSDIAPLCYSCHNNLYINPQTKLKVTVGDSSVFSGDTSHFNHHTTAASYQKTATSTPQGPGSDCDRCHDPHDDTASYTHAFLKPEFRKSVNDSATNPVGHTGVQVADSSHATGTLSRWVRTASLAPGNFCAVCHDGNLPYATATTKAAGQPGSRSVHPVYQPAGFMVWDSTKPASNGSGAGGNPAYTYDPTYSTSTKPAYTVNIDPATGLSMLSTTPIVATTPIPGAVSTYPSSWPTNLIFSADLKDPSTAPGGLSYEGTRVFSQTDGSMVTAAPTGGALTDGTSVVTCESCHSPHGADNGTDSSGVHVLNTMDLGASTGIPGLCSSCHSAPPSS